MKKIVSTTSSTTHVGAVDAGMWLVDGVGYTSNAALIAFCESSPGYTVTDAASAPQAYIDAAARLSAFPARMRGTALRDAADPQSAYQWPSPSARTGVRSTVDVRDVASGVVA